MKNRIINLVLIVCMLLCSCNKASDVSKENESNNSEIGVETNTESELRDVDNNDSDSGDIYYNECKVNIGKYNVDGILTLPVSDEKCPVVVMVQGSGQSDYNAKPITEVAIGLAKKGIASLRITKRFYQFPELYDNTSTVFDEVLDDIYEAIDYVANSESVDKNKIYLLGHSFGAMLGPQIVSEKDVICGFISMAGSARKLEDIILDQNKEYLAGANLGEEQKEKILKEIEATVKQIKKADPSSEDMLLDVSSKYWSSLNDIDYISLAKSIEIPVLILQGTDDKQIYADKDFIELKTLYGKNGESILYEGLDHLFMKEKDTGISENVVNDIAEWIKKAK